MFSAVMAARLTSHHREAAPIIPAAHHLMSIIQHHILQATEAGCTSVKVRVPPQVADLVVLALEHLGYSVARYYWRADGGRMEISWPSHPFDLGVPLPPSPPPRRYEDDAFTLPPGGESWWDKLLGRRDREFPDVNLVWTVSPATTLPDGSLSDYVATINAACQAGDRRE